MSGQPVRTQADMNRFRNEYMNTLKLQEKNNDMNLQANKTYLLTGQLPPQSQLQDTRTTAEKLADVEKMKQEVVESLKPIASPQFGYSIVQKIIESPLNIDNTLFRFLAQRAPSIAEQMKTVMPYGIIGDENDLEKIVSFIKNMYSEQQGKFQTTKSYINSISSNTYNSRIISANDLDSIIMGLNDIIKNISILRTKGNTDRNVKEIADELMATLYFLKEVMPTSNQINLMLEDITDDYNPPNYPGNNVIPDLNVDDMEAVFKLLEKLPKYTEVMALINKIKQFIQGGNTTSLYEGLVRLNKMFVAVEGIKERRILDKFKDIKDRQYAKEVDAYKLEATQKLNFIRQQTEEQREASNAQKVYIVNNENDAVWVRGLQQGQVPQQIAQAPTQVQQEQAPEQAPQRAPQRTQRNNINPLLSALNNVDRQREIEEQDLNQRNRDAENLRVVLTPEQEFMRDVNQLLEQLNVNDFDDIKQRTGIDFKALGRNMIYKMKELFRDYLLQEYRNGRYNLGQLGTVKGFGLKRRGRPRGSGIVKQPPPPKIPNFVGFGINEINQKQLNNGIVKIRRNTKSNYVDMPSKRVSVKLQNILKTIVGGGMPKFNELQSLDEDEKEYLNKLISRSNLEDRLTIPAPSKDAQEKDINQFEILKGQILSGNDNKDLVKKFKILIRKLSKQGLLPKNDVDELTEALFDLGY